MERSERNVAALPRQGNGAEHDPLTRDRKAGGEKSGTDRSGAAGCLGVSGVIS